MEKTAYKIRGMSQGINGREGRKEGHRVSTMLDARPIKLGVLAVMVPVVHNHLGSTSVSSLTCFLIESIGG